MVKGLLKTVKISFYTILIPIWILSLFILWFVPWTPLLHSGLLFYFPYHADGQSRFLRAAGPLTTLWSNDWVPSREIPLTCKTALVASEDANFYNHYGIDLKSIEENLRKNERAHKIKRGGSTITQQLVKNAFLGRERNYLRKAREIVGALILDFVMSKDQQKTWYLNLIEFGPEIYGLEKAAQFYFKTPARKLHPSQCVALMVIIPSPKKWNKALITRRPTSFFLNRYYKILARMRQMGLDTPSNMTKARTFGLWKTPLG